MMVEVDKRTLDMMKAFNEESEKAKKLFNELSNETMRFNEQASNAHVEATKMSDAFSKMAKIPAFEEAQASFADIKDTMKEVKKDMQNMSESFKSPMKEEVRKDMKEMKESFKSQQVRQTITPTTRREEPERRMERREEAKSMTSTVNIQTLRIDVSGVTDKTDKRRLAEDISKMVSTELKRKMGGPMSNTGYDRGA